MKNLANAISDLKNYSQASSRNQRSNLKEFSEILENIFHQKKLSNAKYVQECFEIIKSQISDDFIDKFDECDYVEQEEFFYIDDGFEGRSNINKNYKETVLSQKNEYNHQKIKNVPSLKLPNIKNEIIEEGVRKKQTDMKA